MHLLQLFNLLQLQLMQMSDHRGLLRLGGRVLRHTAFSSLTLPLPTAASSWSIKTSLDFTLALEARRLRCRRFDKGGR